jgi:hypothetical protein
MVLLRTEKINKAININGDQSTNLIINAINETLIYKTNSTTLINSTGTATISTQNFSSY